MPEVIMLSRIRLSLPDIRQALLTIDDTLLSVDDLKAIAKHVPSSEEVRTVLQNIMILFKY